MTWRRRFAIIVVLVIAATAAAFFMMGPSVGASFVATDIETTTHDGEVEAVTVAPSGTISWTGKGADTNVSGSGNTGINSDSKMDG